MERKLGEIFTYNGKIYQVVKGFSCKGCAFIKNGCCDLVNELLGPCDYTKRTDKTNIIFKDTGYTVTKITPGGKCIGIYQFNAGNTNFLKYYKICSQSEWESAIDRLNIWFKDASLKIKKL